MYLDFKGMDKEEIQQILQDSADVVQNDTYRKPLTTAEIDKFKEILAQESVEVFALEQQKKEYVKEMKLLIDPKKAIVKEASYAAHYKEIEESGNLYQMRDQESGQVLYYAEDGTFVKERPMRPDERQLTIQSQIRKVGGE